MDADRSISRNTLAIENLALIWTNTVARMRSALELSLATRIQ